VGAPATAPERAKPSVSRSSLSWNTLRRARAPSAPTKAPPSAPPTRIP